MKVGHYPTDRTVSDTRSLRDIPVRLLDPFGMTEKCEYNLQSTWSKYAPGHAHQPGGTPHSYLSETRILIGVDQGVA